MLRVLSYRMPHVCFQIIHMHEGGFKNKSAGDVSHGSSRLRSQCFVAWVNNPIHGFISYNMCPELSYFE